MEEDIHRKMIDSRRQELSLVEQRLSKEQAAQAAREAALRSGLERFAMMSTRQQQMVTRILEKAKQRGAELSTREIEALRPFSGIGIIGPALEQQFRQLLAQPLKCLTWTYILYLKHSHSRPNKFFDFLF